MSHWSGHKCQWNVGPASDKIDVFLVELIDYSAKLPSGLVKNNPKFAAFSPNERLSSPPRCCIHNVMGEKLENGHFLNECFILEYILIY